MSKICDYLHHTVSNCLYPITFSGDMNNVITRWLVKSQEASVHELFNTEPKLNTDGRILFRHELEFLPKEDIESNWRYYCSKEWSRFLFQYSRIQQDMDLDTQKYIYGLVAIYCKEEHDTMFFISCLTPVSIWINDKLVYTSSFDYHTKETTFVYRLKKGINTLLVEKPHFFNDKNRGVNPDDFNITLKPYDYCAKQEEDYFFDLDMFSKLKERYNVLFSKSIYVKNEQIEAIVLPRYFKEDMELQDVQICAYDELGKLCACVDTMTSTKTVLDLDSSYEGVLKICVRDKNIEHVIQENYIVVGDIYEIAEKAGELARCRKDCNCELISDLNQLIQIPNTKTGVISGSFELMNTWLYGIILQNLYEFIGYTKKTDRETMVKATDIYQHFITGYYKIDIDDNNIFYYVVLPKNYNPSRSYPAVINIDFGYALCRYPDFKEYHLHRSFDDCIMVAFSARGGLNKDYINECNTYELIKKVVKEYNIERDKIYVISTCTGSLKTYGLAIRHPDLFASIFGINGNVRTELNHSDYDQLNNIATIPINQICCVNDSEFNLARVYDVFSRIDNAKLWVVPFYSHEDFNASMNSCTLVKELLKEKRDSYPRKLHFHVYAPIYNHCHWIIVDRIADISIKGMVQAQIIDDNKITVISDNIAKLSLLLNKNEMHLQDTITVSVNGQESTVNLQEFTIVRIDLESDNSGVASEHVSEATFFELFDEIGVDETKMGIKQLYYKKCCIVYSNAYKGKMDSSIKRMLKLLTTPLVERNRNYKYKKFLEADVDSTMLGESNFILLSNLEASSELQQAVLKEAGCEVSKDEITYRGTSYKGDTYAIIKCKNPFNKDKNTLVVIYTSEAMKQKLIDIWSTFDDNLLFYGEAIIYNEDRYYSIRE